MAAWVRNPYTKGQIDRAGQLLANWWVNLGGSLQDEPLASAFGTVESWRTSHSFPLSVFHRVLRRHAKEIDSTSITAKRLKRLSSVMNKLAREPNMKFSQMQDLGGCRAIVANVPAVYKLCERYLKPEADNSPPPWTAKCYDYIKTPKVDGYRGIHVVGRYTARSGKSIPWNGYRIEIQIRSRMQHVFATTVETVTTFTRYPLKFGAGPQHWRRFFSLMGSVMATHEGTPLVAGTPTDLEELIEELWQIVRTLNVRHRLARWTKALRQLRNQDIEGYTWLLIVLNLANTTVKVTGFADPKEASSAIAEIEKAQRKDVDAVLVWVESITDLKEAYPNYYADTREFLTIMNASVAFFMRRRKHTHENAIRRI